MSHSSIRSARVRGVVAIVVATAAVTHGVLVGGTSLLATPQAAVAAASNMPSGFTDSFVASVPSPTAVEGLPDGRVVVLDKERGVRVIKNGVLLSTPALSIALGSCITGEQGFLGLAVDAAFSLNRFVYVFYTRPKGTECVNRVSRFTFNAGADTISRASEVVLLDNIPGTETEGGTNHNGGDVEIGSDGYLYVAIGDSGQDPRNNSGGAGNNDAAQDLSLLSGKIVRIATNGATPSTNPFAASANRVSCRTTGVSTATIGKVCQEIYAYGLRNPYRFAFDPNTSTTRFFINDVGQGTREEVNAGKLGANYGWPAREGRCPQGDSPPCAGPPSGVTDPITDYSRSYGTYITGGAFVPNGAWPVAYDGAYLFTDGSSGKIYVRRANGSVDYNAPLAEGLNVPSHMTFISVGGVWALYYTEHYSGVVRRITYNVPTAPTVSGLVARAIKPTRVYDTTANVGGAGTGLLLGGSGRLVKTNAPAGARAALVNISAVQPLGNGSVIVGLPRARMAGVTAVSVQGSAVSNAVLVPLDSAGAFTVRATVTMHLRVDVMSYFVPASAPTNPTGRFRPVTSARLIDTTKPPGTVLPGGSTNGYAIVGDHIDINVNGRMGVPVSGVHAAVLQVTAAGSTTGGTVVVYPAGVARTAATNLSVRSGVDARTNLVVVPVGTSGKVSVWRSSGVASLLVEVVGWFGSSTAPAYSRGALTVRPPIRALDTRAGAPVAGGTNRLIDVDSSLGTASRTGVLQNITAIQTASSGVLTAYRGDAPLPTFVSLRVTAAGQTRSSAALTPLSTTGTERVRSSGATHLLVDLYGWFN